MMDENDEQNGEGSVESFDTFELYVENLLLSFIEVELSPAKEDGDFLKIKETLTRIGVASTRESTLWQSCHILHKRGRYFIVHFKELFALDGKKTNFDTADVSRRNTIASLLEEWKLLKIINPDVCKEPRAPLFQIKVIAHKDKTNWTLEPKYSIGNKGGQAWKTQQ